MFAGGPCDGEVCNDQLISQNAKPWLGWQRRVSCYREPVRVPGMWDSTRRLCVPSAAHDARGSRARWRRGALLQDHRSGTQLMRSRERPRAERYLRPEVLHWVRRACGRAAKGWGRRSAAPRRCLGAAGAGGFAAAGAAAAASAGTARGHMYQGRLGMSFPQIEIPNTIPTDSDQIPDNTIPTDHANAHAQARFGQRACSRRICACTRALLPCMQRAQTAKGVQRKDVGGRSAERTLCKQSWQTGSG